MTTADPLPTDLAAARAGDSAGFDRLVRPYRRELRAHCYRMTGSLADADDVLQESLLRAYRGLPSFAERSSLRTWLFRIATNACLTALAERRPRMLPWAAGAPGDPASPPAAPDAEPVWLEPCPESFWEVAPASPEARFGARESVATAFLAALQELPPLQRAVLVLRDVLGWSASEVAELLDTTVAAANSALQRARATLEARRDRIAAGVALDPADERTRTLLQRYVAAWESGDAEALAALLREDATLTMPPVPTWFRGRDAIRAFLSPMLGAMGSFRLRPIIASGAPAAAAWLRAPGERAFRAQSIHVLSCDASGVAGIDVFMTPALFPRFELPSEG